MLNKRYFLAFALFTLTHVMANAATHTVTGELQIVQVPASSQHAARIIRVWLPLGYDSDLQTHYPVLYMQDGQSCFDRATSAYGKEWQIDEALTTLIAKHQIPSMIVVGIDNAGPERLNEYTFVSDPKHGGGDGATYADLLLNHIKLFVEKSYRVRVGPQNTFIGGSSVGALVSIEIARRHPGIFGGIIAMSPSIWWANQAITKEIEHDPAGLHNTHIWLDIGTHEDPTVSDTENQKTVNNARRLDQVLSKLNIPHRLTITDGAHHDELAWAKRFPDAIVYLLKNK
jgi:predicted alpha/beta superfamily hydrolase